MEQGSIEPLQSSMGAHAALVEDLRIIRRLEGVFDLVEHCNTSADPRRSWRDVMAKLGAVVTRR